jgi:hypothetical protein
MLFNNSQAHGSESDVRFLLDGEPCCVKLLKFKHYGFESGVMRFNLGFDSVNWGAMLFMKHGSKVLEYDPDFLCLRWSRHVSFFELLSPF